MSKAGKLRWQLEQCLSGDYFLGYSKKHHKYVLKRYRKVKN